jgi:putative phosphoribosyl transferase
MNARFHDRCEAGRLLAQALSAYAGRADVLVLALPRGGVPVAREIARALSAPLDVLMVHRLSVPHHHGRTLGAIASGGGRVIDEAVAHESHVSHDAIEHAIENAVDDLTRREHAYRGAMFGPYLHGHTIIVVDDGVTTGATMRAALQVARRQEPARIVVAVPVTPAQICEILRREADEVVSLSNPDPFVSIDACYEHFPQVTDEDARRQLEQFAQTRGQGVVPDGSAMTRPVGGSEDPEPTASRAE